MNSKQLSLNTMLTMLLTLLTLTVLNLITSIPVIAQNGEVGENDFRISDMGPDGDTDYYATESAVAYNSVNNEYLVVWVGADTTSNKEQEIFMQRIDAATGLEVGQNDTRISDMGPDGNTQYYAANPVVVYNLLANEYLVLWVGSDEGVGEWDVYGQRIDGKTGTEIGTNDFRISDMGPDNNADYKAIWVAAVYNPTIDKYFIVWTGDDNTPPLVDNEIEVFGQRLNTDGSETGTNDFRITHIGPDGDPNYDVGNIDLSYNNINNEYLLVWQSNYDDQETTINGQRLDATTTKVGQTGFLIGDMGDRGDRGTRRPEVAYNSESNEYLVIWEGDTHVSLADDEFEIFGQRLNAITGQEIGANDFRVSDMGPDGDAGYDAITAEIAYSSQNNEYLVVWQGDDNRETLVNGEQEIFGQRIKADGTEIGENDFRLSDMGTDGDTAFDIYRYVAMVYNNTNNEYLIIWDADDNTGVLVDKEYEIFGQRYALDTPVSPTPTATSVTNPTPAIDQYTYLPTILKTFAPPPTPTPDSISFKYQRTYGLTEQAYLDDTQHLNKPNGLFIDSNDNLYLVEENGNRLLRFNSAKANSLAIGTAGLGLTDEDIFDSPKDVTLDNQGNIWVVDEHRLTQFDADGNYLQVFPDWDDNPWSSGSDNGSFDDPWGITFDSSGRLAVADRDNNRVQLFNLSSGKPVYESSIADLDNPTQLLFDSSNRLYISDAGNYRVQRCEQSGSSWACTQY